MGNPVNIKYARRKLRGARDHITCHCCKNTIVFCWKCRCGFAICQSCLLENEWGLSCNGITWQCPDCGCQNGLGNQ